MQQPTIPSEHLADTTKNIQDTWHYKVFRSLCSLLEQLSLASLHKIGTALSLFYWYLVPSRKQIAIDAVAKHLRLPPEEATRLARASVENNCKSFMEIFHTGYLHANHPIVECEDTDNFRRYQQEHGPIVCITAHLGAWELLNPYAATSHPGRPKIVVVRKQKIEYLSEIMRELRTSGGMEAIDHRLATTKAMDCLRNNGVVAFLADHNTRRREAIFLPFLEDIAAVNQGPALIALRAKAIVFPVFLLRNGQKMRLRMDAPLDTKELTGTVSERVHTIASFYTDAIARHVRACPEQWFWMHKRWATRPKYDNPTQ